MDIKKFRYYVAKLFYFQITSAAAISSTMPGYFNVVIYFWVALFIAYVDFYDYHPFYITTLLHFLQASALKKTSLCLLRRSVVSSPFYRVFHGYIICVRYESTLPFVVFHIHYKFYSNQILHSTKSCYFSYTKGKRRTRHRK